MVIVWISWVYRVETMNPSDDGPMDDNWPMADAKVPCCPACGYPENGFDDPNPLHYLDCSDCAENEPLTPPIVRRWPMSNQYADDEQFG